MGCDAAGVIATRFSAFLVDLLGLFSSALRNCVYLAKA
jgi:hypothetical protein